MAVIDRSTAPHYAWGEGCDGWRLRDGDALSVIEERMPAGTSETRHVHDRAEQVFYVLEGILTIEIGGAVHRLRAFDAFHVEPGQPHEVRNDGPSDAARFLVISSPTTTGDRRPPRPAA